MNTTGAPAATQHESEQLFSLQLTELYKISLKLALAASPDELYAQAIGLSRRCLGFDRMSIWFVDPRDPRYMLGTYGIDEHDEIRDQRGSRVEIGANTPRGNLLTGSIPLIYVPDADLLDDHSNVVGRGDKVLAALWDNNQAIGLISADNLLSRRPITEQQIQLLVLFAQFVGHLSTLKKTEDEIRRRNQELEVISHLLRATTTQLDVQAILDNALRGTLQLTGLEGGTLCLVDGTTRTLALAAAHNASPDMVSELSAHKIKIGDCLCGRAAETGQPLILWDNASGTDYATLEAVRAEGLRFHGAFPLQVKDRTIGVLCHFARTTAKPTPRQLALVQDLCGPIALAIENAQLYQAEREARRRLQDSQAQLVQAEKMAALGRLTASIAHEINNPLQAMQNSLELIEEDLAGTVHPDKLGRYTRMAYSEVQRLANLVRRLRDFYRPSPQATRPTDVNAVVQNVLELVHKQLQHSKITVEHTEQVGLPLVSANPDQLIQVFLNLILNAIDAMPGGGTLSVRTQRVPDRSGMPNRQAVCIEFQDTGAGIAPEMLSRIFEPFATGKEHGTGLGLYICYEIVQAHQGQLSVANQAGQGTTFTVLLPAISPTE